MDRFRPIIMTTLAAVMGAVPIALGWGADGESRRSLGLVIVGGLIVSQFITLYVTPVIYLYLEVFQEKVLDRTSFFRSSHAPRRGPDSDPGMTEAAGPGFAGNREGLALAPQGAGNGAGNGNGGRHG
jgi:hypothetical protein